MSGTSEVDKVIRNDFCIGCGACAAVSPESFEIAVDAEGKKQAVRRAGAGWGADTDAADLVCPFGDKAEDETSITVRLYPDLREDMVIGRYASVHAGHVTSGGFRERGSSGGGVSWLVAELFARDEIELVVHVGQARRTASSSAARSRRAPRRRWRN